MNPSAVKKLIIVLTYCIMGISCKNAKRKRTLERMIQELEDIENRKINEFANLIPPPFDAELHKNIFEMDYMSRFLCNKPGKPSPGCRKFDPEQFAAEKSVLCFHSNGRLGNQMSSYASLYAMAKIMNFRPYLYRDNHESLSQYFKHIEIGVIEDEYCNPCHLPWTKLSDLPNAPKRLETERIGKAIVKLGYSQYPEMYLEFLPELRKIFEPKDFYQAQAKELISKPLNGTLDGLVLVGVHVRRTDFFVATHRIVTNNQRDSAIKSYYDQARAYFRDKFENKVRFFVVGDDPKWNQAQLASDEDTFVVGTSGDDSISNEDQVGTDFSVLLSCDHIIMSFGTFGQWAGLLVGGETLMVDSSDSFALEEPALMKAHGAPNFRFLELNFD
ncbi:galactoside alpha-(1,2)-fucosyltransferase 2-like [Tigriopus californicus]|uniref:galactoside alpha-(1,2)-fucosyltransferase 2-like n=1 Tax=Tigriopus californicus TaxID=6832 RepID=UPI0027DA1DF6|nr:galactoside alpha-(1,2)-fucosyltransferase 2-like [Tigriopus californicus]|eukprot:TCALIF_06157-PA protein Name:"Similar to Fut2 Galactoside 2-alpha-L-fucosyltransferase 2 (Mus musculus)" AED:0.25 eAED:0.28 QI:0/-1/0/1/-1/1/1/0/386